MQPIITTLAEKKLVGLRLPMSLAADRTPELWCGFLPRRQEIKQVQSTAFFLVKIYDIGYFQQFDANASFEKWAAVEVNNFEKAPKGLEAMTLPAGLYAVFLHQGSSTDHRIFQYIFGEWLPNSKEYALDDRPHFDLLDKRYKNNDPESEEEIWVPIRRVEG